MHLVSYINFLFILTLFECVACFHHFNSSLPERKDLIVSAITGHIKGFELNSKNAVNFILQSSHEDINDVVDKILPCLQSGHSYRLIVGNYYFRKKVNEYWKYNLFFIDDDTSLIALINDKIYDFSGHFLVVFLNPVENPIKTFQKIFQNFFELYILKAMIAYRNHNQIEFYTYYPFSTRNCDTVTPVLNEIFTDDDYEKNFTFNSEVLYNFHGCPFRCTCFNIPPIMEITRLPNGELYPNGFDAKILKELAKKLNFTWTILLPEQNLGRGVIFKNGSSTGMMNLLIDGPANFTICGLIYSYDRSKWLSGSITYYSVVHNFAIPPFQIFSSFYRLFFPFDTHIWSLIAITFIGTFFLTTIMNFFDKKYKNFIAGDNNSSPCLQMFSLILGVAISNVPKRNFARTLLLIWIFSSTILRTSYQGVLYKFLQKREYNFRQETIDDMISSGYFAYVSPVIANLISSLRIPTEQIKPLIGNVNNYYDRLHDPKARAMVLYSDVQLKYYNSLDWSKPALRSLPEIVGLLRFSVLFKKNSFLKEPFNRVLERFIESGLVNFWVSQSLNRTEKADRFRQIPNPVINQADLEGCFIFTIGLLAASVFVFILEVLSTWVQRGRQFI